MPVQLAKDSGFAIQSWILFYKRHWRKEQLLLLQAMQPFRGSTAKSKWRTVNSRAELLLQRIISMAVDHAWLYATNAFSLFMRACSIHMQTWAHAHSTTEHTEDVKPKSFLWEATLKYIGLITWIRFFFTSSLWNNACLAWYVDVGLLAYLHGYQCVEDLLCDLVSYNLHLLIRRLQKG